MPLDKSHHTFHEKVNWRWRRNEQLNKNSNAIRIVSVVKVAHGAIDSPAPLRHIITLKTTQLNWTEEWTAQTKKHEPTNPFCDILLHKAMLSFIRTDELSRLWNPNRRTTATVKLKSYTIPSKLGRMAMVK